mgnify:CR=1 FL=1
MNPEIIISLIFGIASIMSSICFGLIPTIRKTKLEKLEHKIQRLLLNHKLFYEIEDELLNRLSNYDGNKKTIKSQVRNLVSQNNDGKVLSDEAKPSVYNKQIK